MRCKKILTGSAVAALKICVAGAALAGMGGATIMDRVDTDGDKTLSLAEVRSAAAKRYDLIQSKNGGHVTMLQLGGRLVPADLKGVDSEPSLNTVVTKDQYLALAGKFFDAADAKRKKEDAPGSGKLDVDELGSDAGKKLVVFSSNVESVSQPVDLAMLVGPRRALARTAADVASARGRLSQPPVHSCVHGSRTITIRDSLAM